MRPRQPSPDHQAAVARRLALLSEELSTARPAPALRPSVPAAWPAGGDQLERPWWDDHTRLAGDRPGPPPLVHSAAPPGRHAAPRSIGRFLPVGPGQLVVVALVVVVGLAATCWWLVRAHPTAARIEAAPTAGLAPTTSAAAPESTSGGAAAAVADATPTGPATGPAAGPAASPATVTVDVSGKVRHPGVKVLDAGARVADALQAAGGAKAGVDLTALNLAQVLVDGQQVLVGQAAPPVGATSAPVASASGPPAVVDLNTATAEQLDGLPDVGPVTASSILAWRDAHGGFTSVDELLEVDGIGEVTLGKIAPYVRV